MSEQGWQAFLAAEGVSDWVVLHGGATAAFHRASLGEPARLAVAVASGYDAAADDTAVEPLRHGSTVWMQDLDETKQLRHAMHVDVSVARERAEVRLAAALAAGGRVVDDSHAPEYWIQADRAGNRACIAAWPDGGTATPAANHDTP
jgi:hypothetical protein